MSHSMSYWLWCKLQLLPRDPFAKKHYGNPHEKSPESCKDWSPAQGALYQSAGVACCLQTCLLELRGWSRISVAEDCVKQRERESDHALPKAAKALLSNSFPRLVSFHLVLTTLFSINGSFAGPRGPRPTGPSPRWQAMRGQAKSEANYANAKSVRLTTSS